MVATLNYRARSLYGTITGHKGNLKLTKRPNFLDEMTCGSMKKSRSEAAAFLTLNCSVLSSDRGPAIGYSQGVKFDGKS